METAALLASLREKGVRLWVEDGSVKCSAPAGALDPAMRAALSQQKEALKTLLTQAQTAKEHSALVPINPGRPNRLPLFAVSGHGGDVFYLLQLARHLDPDQPVFGVRPKGLDGSEPLTTVEAIAQYEIEQIRRYCPNGPYLIAGHCAGGTIAFEVARQLTAAGQRVALLTLLGSPFPAMFRPVPQAIHRVSRLARALASGSAEGGRRYIATKLRNRLPWFEARVDGDLANTVARHRVEAATVAAVRAYRPAFYSGALDVFVTADKWHSPHRWRDVAATVREHAIPDYGIDDLLLGSAVWKLAEVLQNRLHEVRSTLSEVDALARNVPMSRTT